MRILLTRRHVGAILTPALILLAACGSADTEPAATEPGAETADTVGATATPDTAPDTIPDTVPDTAPATAPDTAPSEPPETDGSSDAGPTGADSDFCKVGAELDELSLELTAGPDEVRTQMEQLVSLATEAAALAPDEYRPFVERTSQLQQDFYDLLAANDFDFEAASADPDSDIFVAFDTLDQDFPGIEQELDAYCGFGDAQDAEGSLVGRLPLDGDDVDGAAVCDYLTLLDLDDLVGASDDALRPDTASCSAEGATGSVNLVISQNSAAANYDNSAELFGVETELPDLGTKGFSSGPYVVVLAADTLVTLQILSDQDVDTVAAMETILDALDQA